MTRVGLAIGIFAIVGAVIFAVVGIVDAINGNGGGSQDYMSCVAMAERPGTDPNAKCMSGGEVIPFREYAGR